MAAARAHAAAVSQQDFASALLDPARAVPAGLRSASGLGVARRFAVHRNNTVVALVDALASAFPVTRALVGEDFFRAMARERVLADPPRSPVITDYGDGFAAFIARFAPAAGVPYLPDMARLEQLRVRAYHDADAVPVAAEAYAALVATPARLATTRLTLHPACHWLHSEYAVYSLWQAHQGLADAADADLSAIRIDAAEDVMVTRPQWDVSVTALPAGGIAWLEALRDGLTLDIALSHAHGASDASQLEALLTLIVRHGLAVALVASAPTDTGPST